MASKTLDSYSKISQALLLHPELQSDRILKSRNMIDLCNNIDKLSDDYYFGFIGFESEIDIDSNKLKLTFICELPEANPNVDDRMLFCDVISSANEMVATLNNPSVDDNIRLELFYDL